MQDEKQAAQELDHEFSTPWEQSDAILLVEGQKFHVHRLILSMSSPVFSRMFSSDFREKDADEIPLPEKKAEEIREMLLVIYPSFGKRVDDTNYQLLLPLAHEYQMKVLTEKCEDHLLRVIEKVDEIGPLLENLIIAQNYTLERVRSEMVNKTQKLSIEDVQGHELYEQVEPLTQRNMIELQMRNMERKLHDAKAELRESKAENSKLLKKIKEMKRLASVGLDQFDSVVSSISDHIRHARKSSYWGFTPTTDQHLTVIFNEMFTRNPPKNTCRGFSGIHTALQNLQTNLKAIKRLDLAF